MNLAFVQPAYFIDSDHPAVIDFARAHAGGDGSDRDRAVRLYYAVRDGFRYNPWGVLDGAEGFRASTVLTRPPESGAHCVDKATVMAACARALDIPSRLHFANVRNHIGTADLERKLGTDILVFHGYVELHLGGRWVAATPAFNASLCERLGVDALEFDGEHDSIFQAYDREGGAFMEYVHDYGSFPDIPYHLMVSAWQQHYRPFRETGQWPTKD